MPFLLSVLTYKSIYGKLLAMIGINVGISVCLALLIVIAACAVIGLVRSGSRKGRIDYVRNFKRGKCIIIYIAVIPLFMIGLSYAGKNFGESFFGAISESADLIFLDCSLVKVSELASASVFYTATMYFAFSLVLINAILFTASILQQMIWHFVKNVTWRCGERDRLIIFGNNECSRITYDSAKEHKGKIIVGKKLSADEKYALFADGVMYSNVGAMLKYIQKRLDKKTSKGRHFTNRTVLVVNTGDEVENISLCRELVKVIKYVGYIKEKSEDEDRKRFKELPEIKDNEPEEKKDEKGKEAAAIKKQIVELFSHFRVYVFGDAANEALYREIMQNSYGCIRYVNRYNRAAIDFIDEYPLARFMDEKHVDYATSLVRPGVDINVTMIGFGDTSRQIFLASVANNQFLTSDGSGKAVLKPVHYHIFDKDAAQHNKNLNHSYYRYRNEFFELDENARPKTKDGKFIRPKWISESDYLELPELPSDDEYIHLDINDAEFYIRLKNIFTHKAAAVDYVIVSYGTDLENIDLAQKLLEKKKEWGVENLVVFVKVNTADNVTDIFERNDCFRIAEYASIYDINRIDNDALMRMSDSRNHLYVVETVLRKEEKAIREEGRAQLSSAEIMEKLKKEIPNEDYKWYVSRKQFERDSNTYASLSLRSKLLLMGLDYVRADAEGKGLSDEEYLAVYANGDAPEYLDGVESVYPEAAFKGKRVIKYEPLKFKPSLRTTMAIQEHYRWNSYMLSIGFIPADKKTIVSEVKDDRGKNYELRRHGNLTSFEGLVEFREIVAKKLCGDSVTAEALEASVIENDVIKYDYQLMDNAYWLLKQGGYKIIQRKK